MSKEEDKVKHKTRMHRAWITIKKQLGIIKSKQHFLGASKQIDEAQPHRLAKKHAMDCGKDQLTPQERRNNQKGNDVE